MVESPDAGPIDLGPVTALSVAALDRSAGALPAGGSEPPLEARLLILSADGAESELGAIRSVLDHRGVPYDVFVAASETLTASRLQASGRGLYQGIVLTSSALPIGGSSSLSSTEWAALADYEATYRVRRAVLAAWPDPALGFGSYTSQDTTTTPLAVRCTSAGMPVFRDVNCSAWQSIAGGSAYLSTPAAGAPLTTLLADGAGRALAAVHTGSDGRQSLLLLFRNHRDRLHSQLLLHGVLGWVAGGTYLGERRLTMSAQVDDMFVSSNVVGGGTFRLGESDLEVALAWIDDRRGEAITPAFRLAWAFNGRGAADGEALTEAAVARSGDWHWITHTWNHKPLDTVDYAEAHDELARNIELAADLPLDNFDAESLVTPNVSGLVNPEAMRAAADLGIRYAVTDTSKPGCDNPSPNTTFYNELEPRILLVPRRPGGLAVQGSTPAQWVTWYSANNDETLSYPELIEKYSNRLLLWMGRGEADPWMYHQANLRAYDGTRSLLGDLLEATLDKHAARSVVPVQTPSMAEIGRRFARRLAYDAAGVRATLFRGRALVIDAGRAVTVPVTGVRAADGESYGGDVIKYVSVGPGASACVPLDGAGVGCSPAPVREGGAGPTRALPMGRCNATGVPPPDPTPTITAIARGSSWRYWDRGGDLGTAWRARSFADGTWASGPGGLGYGESYLRTVVSYGPSSSSKYITTYFRRSFDVADPAAVSKLLGEVMYDDGFVVYLNGTEIGRAAMPAGAVTASTLSTGYETGNAYASFDWSARRDLLVAGSNTIAVEVHQAWPTSSDLSFDLALRLETSGTPPPPPPPPPPPTYDGGVPRRGAWWYWDGGGDRGTSWRTQTSGGTGWKSGAGPFGYGESYLATTVSYGTNASAKHITTYFTTTLRVDDPAAVTTLFGDVMYDDGFVVYLNGAEIGRSNMPAGTVTASTLSTGYETGNAYRRFDWSAGRARLVAGVNVIAVEVHQASPSSSDLAFDLSLSLGPAPERVARGSAWWYWDNGGDRGTAWRTQTSGATGWDTGSGPFGYGESYLRTVVSYGPSASAKYITTYFTTTLQVADPALVRSMIGEVMYDDGFVVYLNGTEIARRAMPAGAVTASTLSTGYETGNAYAPFDWSGSRGLLRAGTNVIAVEVHQAGPTSSDLTFDLALALGR